MRLRRSTASETRFEMAPLIDVVFLLLTFFIFALVMMVRADILDVDLPALGGARPADAADLITVSVLEDGAIAIDGEPIELAGLIPAIRGALAERPAAKLVLAVDQGGRSGDLLAVADELAQAGFGQFAVVARTGGADAGSGGQDPSGETGPVRGP